MDTEINWQKVAVVFIAVTGVAFIFFFFFIKSIEKVVLVSSVVPSAVTLPKSEGETVVSSKESSQNDQNTYKNEQYGFGLIFLKQTQQMTECQSSVKYAYDPVREYIFSDKKIACAVDVKDHEKFYTEQGAQLETLVFDMTKCADTVTDKVEKVFCDKYGKISETEGNTTGKRWPSGSWVRSSDYVTFFTPLASQKSADLVASYKFLMKSEE